MKPLHGYIFQILESIPQDGTFDQLKPVKLLLKQKPKRVWSYDLSAATDRLPIGIQEDLLAQIFGSEFGSLWRSLLVGREYLTPKGVIPKAVRYIVGQPMGALSSWAMLALTHHCIVQLAAVRAG